MRNKQNFDEENEVEFPGKRNEDRNTIEKIQDFVERNSKKVIIVTIAVAALIYVGFYLKDYYQEKAETAKQEASLALSRITPYVDNLDYQHALYGDTTKKVRNEDIIGLIKIIEKYEDTPQGKIAALYAGNCFLGLKNYTEAARYFEKALNSETNEVLGGANAGLGVCKEIEGKTGEAVKFYEKAAELVITPEAKNRYQIFAALLSEKSDKAKAASIYRDIIAEGVSPEYAAKAKEGLARMGESLE